MSEKVKLPKNVCDALDSITTYAEDSEIVHLVYTGACDTWDTQRLSEVTPNTIMRALVLGYEPELTPEERIKERYKNGFRGNSQAIFQAGIREALQIHGIKYDWLDQME